MATDFHVWREINASVGKRGANHHEDVVTVQELLNDVPAGEGGPTPKLKVDGICGPKTIGAIRKFQLREFGWRGADGLVEPHRRTHGALQRYYRQDLVSTSFIITRSRVDRIGHEWEWDALGSEEEWYFRVEQFATAETAIYWFGRKPRDMLYRPRPVAYRGRPTRFSVRARGGVSVADLQCSGTYKTRKRGSDIATELVLWLPSGLAVIQLDTGKQRAPLMPYLSLPFDYHREGAFQFITAVV